MDGAYRTNGKKTTEESRGSAIRLTGAVGDTLEQIAREGAQRLLAEALELEVTEFLQRARYQRGVEKAFRGYRNG